MFIEALNYIRKNLRNSQLKPKEVFFVGFEQTGCSIDILHPQDPATQTKKEFNRRIRKAATFCGAYYVDSRWLPGIITNCKQTSRSVRRMRLLDKNLRVAPTKPFFNFSRKVASKFTREFSRLCRILLELKLCN